MAIDLLPTEENRTIPRQRETSYREPRGNGRMAVTLFLLITDGRCRPTTSLSLSGFVIFICHFTASDHGETTKKHPARLPLHRRRPPRRSSQKKPHNRRRWRRRPRRRSSRRFRLYDKVCTLALARGPFTNGFRAFDKHFYCGNSRRSYRGHTKIARMFARRFFPQHKANSEPFRTRVAYFSRSISRIQYKKS